MRHYKKKQECSWLCFSKAKTTLAIKFRVHEDATPHAAVGPLSIISRAWRELSLPNMVRRIDVFLGTLLLVLAGVIVFWHCLLLSLVGTIHGKESNAH